MSPTRVRLAHVDDDKPIRAFVEEALVQVDWNMPAERYES